MPSLGIYTGLSLQMNTAIELTYNINVTLASLSGAAASRALRLSRLLEPNLNLFPTAIQNGHINLIIRCVIRLADERLSLDGIKSVCPLFVDSRRWYKIEKGAADGAFSLQTSNGHVSRVATSITNVSSRSVHQHISCAVTSSSVPRRTGSSTAIFPSWTFILICFFTCGWWNSIFVLPLPSSVVVNILFSRTVSSPVVVLHASGYRLGHVACQLMTSRRTWIHHAH